MFNFDYALTVEDSNCGGWTYDSSIKTCTNFIYEEDGIAKVKLSPVRFAATCAGTGRYQYNHISDPAGSMCRKPHCASHLCSVNGYPQQKGY